MKIKDNIIIKIDSIVKKYADIIALKGLSLNIYKGDKVALIGANGAGKSTLLEIIVGTIKATSGKIHMNFDYKFSPLEKIGIQFQDATYPESLTVSEIIEFFVDVSNNKIDQKAFDEMIKAFQMLNFINKKAQTLSGGQKQKLSVFLALVSNPEIILLDELTTGLDVSVSKSITEFIKKYISHSHKTTILVSHNPYEIERLCDRIIAMKNGEIVYDKSIIQAKKDFKNLNLLMESFI